MAAELRATGLTEEQATALLDELNERGFAGARSTSNADDESRIDVTVGSADSTDVSALSGLLDTNRIQHAIVEVDR